MKVKIPNGYNVVDEYRTDITSPAYINPSKRELHINHTTFDRLTPDEQDFILCHELAHRYTVSELRADQMGFERLMKLTNSPKVAVNALYKALSGAMPEHDLRYARMLQIAAEYDLSHNHNENAKQVLQIANKLVENAKKTTIMLDQQNEEKVVDMLIGQGYDVEEIYDAIERLEDSGEIGFEGAEYYASGKVAERKAARQAKREERKAAKEDRKQRKAEAKTRRQEARAEKAELRNAAKQAKIDRKNKIADAKANKINAKAVGIANGTYDPMGGLGNALGGIVDKFTGGGGDEYVEEKSTSSNLPLILGISGGVLLVVIVVVILATRKK
jgi:hypothetical protein